MNKSFHIFLEIPPKFTSALHASFLFVHTFNEGHKLLKMRCGVNDWGFQARFSVQSQNKFWIDILQFASLYR
jgi:hypothetical protein